MSCYCLLFVRVAVRGRIGQRDDGRFNSVTMKLSPTSTTRLVTVKMALVKIYSFIRGVFLIGLCVFAKSAIADASRPFALRIVDDQTGRGVPLVELKTTSSVRFYTDSAGYAAIDDPSLLGHKIFFYVWSHGYEYPADGFGIRGKAT